jgi:hypothetical protein
MNDALRPKHRGLIDGLGKIFDLLDTLRYLAATDVSLPPTMLRLTDGGSYGAHLLYDTTDREYLLLYRVMSMLADLFGI